MRKIFFPRLAWNGIKNNRRLYIPYILTCAGMVMMTYILQYLSVSPAVMDSYGGTAIVATMMLGSFVMVIFSVIFLFYTNSFLIRRRGREFGLYNILGMDKRGIARILIWETLTSAVISLAVGFAAGIGLSKLAQLGLNNITSTDINYEFTISIHALRNTAVMFLVIFALLFIRSLVKLNLSTAVSLLGSESFGEKPPRANPIIGIGGIILLGGAYWLAVSIEDPVSALVIFFLAVIMVIVATYMIFISGSVLVCRMLQKNKKYYYNKRHFVSVASMVYRMKRNGAGLASICILATMVLVMLSSTTCLYFGSEGSIRARCPRDVTIRVGFHDNAYVDGTSSQMREIITNGITYAGDTPQNLLDYRSVAIVGLLENEDFEINSSSVNSYNPTSFGNLMQLVIVPLEDYNRMTGENVTLSTGEALYCAGRSALQPERVNVGDCSFTIVEFLDSVPMETEDSMLIIPTVYMVAPDFDSVAESLLGLVRDSGNTATELFWNYCFDSSLPDAEQIAMAQSIREQLILIKPYDEETDTFYHYLNSCTSKASERRDFMSTFGSLLYLGILLSIVFVAAAALIIYYKQITEGYEDKSRFEIMMKVGMTKKNIRSSINSQLLTVFYLPLIFAGLHLTFAFPFIAKIMTLFNLDNVSLLIGTTVVSFIIFALFYMLVYRLTSNAYYSIVSRND